MYIEEKLWNHTTGYLFRLDSFNAHSVRFSLQNFEVRDAIFALKDSSVLKSHSNCLRENNNNNNNNNKLLPDPDVIVEYNSFTLVLVFVWIRMEQIFAS